MTEFLEGWIAESWLVLGGQLIIALLGMGGQYVRLRVVACCSVLLLS